jgi:DNA-binding NtrC family response regulator
LLSKPNILIIDDHIDIANAIKITLQKDCFNVGVFNDHFLTLGYFKSNLKKFAVVLSDVRLLL